MTRIRIATACLTVLSLLTAVSGLAGRAGAAPGGAQLTAGTCRLVNLQMSDPGTGLRITATTGAACVEFDNNSGGFVRTGGMTLTGSVVSCTDAAGQVEANVTFTPVNRVHDPYTSLRLSLRSSGGATAATLLSGGTPPHFVGAGSLVAGAANSCTSATWSSGVLAWEDPVVT